MRRFRSQMAIALVPSLVLATGCKTPTRTVNIRPTSTGDKEASSPFLKRGDYPEELGLMIHEVLADHRFTAPWTAVRGSDSTIWFVADRFESSHRFDRLYVTVGSKERVTVSITPYVQDPTDWAILGRLFGDHGPESTSIEAGSIAAEIRKRLDQSKPAAK
jgi:hypothetical protein